MKKLEFIEEDIYFPKNVMRELQKEIHQNAKDKGWWPENSNIPEKICMVHTELSEAVDEFRNHKPNLYYIEDGDGNKYKYSDKPEGIGIELADAVIRLLDLAEYLNFDLMEMVKIKMEYNKTRAYRHGGKKC